MCRKSKGAFSLGTCHGLAISMDLLTTRNFPENLHRDDIAGAWILNVQGISPRMLYSWKYEPVAQITKFHDYIFSLKSVVYGLIFQNFLIKMVFFGGTTKYRVKFGYSSVFLRLLEMLATSIIFIF